MPSRDSSIIRSKKVCEARCKSPAGTTTSSRKSSQVNNFDTRWPWAAADALPYSSYTEEEFHRALDRWKKTGSPEIFVFFKHVTPREMGDPGEQLKKVLAFRQSLEDSRQVLHRFFADEQEFKVEVNRHLRAFAKGELPKADAPLDGVLLPLHAIEEVQKAKAEAQQHKDRAEELALVLAEQAAIAALEGRVEQARQIFAKAHQGTTNYRVLSLAYEFYDRMGNLASAEEMLERCLAISGPDVEIRDTADMLQKLGSIVFKRGNYNRAQDLWEKARSLFAEIGMVDREQQAQQFSNLLKPIAETATTCDSDLDPIDDAALITGTLVFDDDDE